jgi:MORC family CW-type zinc finger protein
MLMFYSFQHQLEMQIILTYSPFRTMDEFREQFNKLNTKKSGTLVLVYNLKLLESGEPELDFETDPYDIRLSDPEGEDRT